MRLAIRSFVFALMLAALASIGFQSTAGARTPARSAGEVCPSDGYDAYCGQNRNLIVYGHGFKPNSAQGAYCYYVQNLYVSTGRTRIVEDVLGYDIRARHYVRAGQARRICVDLPESGCPKINLRARNGDSWVNFGTFPTCGSHWRLPTTANPVLTVCPKNRSKHTRTLLETVYGTLRQTARVAPGDRGCVSTGFRQHWNKPVQVMWQGKTSAVNPRNILLSSYIWRN